MNTHYHTPEGLLTAEELLKAIWPIPPRCPSLRWLRELHARLTLPRVNLCCVVVFDAAKERLSFAKRFTLEAA